VAASLHPAHPLSTASLSQAKDRNPLGRGCSGFASFGYGSVPSDPRREYHIGNQGSRKPVKIRKIEKSRFDQSNSDYTVS